MHLAQFNAAECCLLNLNCPPSLPACLPARLPACLPAVIACLPACPACLYSSACRPSGALQRFTRLWTPCASTPQTQPSCSPRCGMWPPLPRWCLVQSVSAAAAAALPGRLCQGGSARLSSIWYFSQFLSPATHTHAWFNAKLKPPKLHMNGHIKEQKNHQTSHCALCRTGPATLLGRAPRQTSTMASCRPQNLTSELRMDLLPMRMDPLLAALLPAHHAAWVAPRCLPCPALLNQIKLIFFTAGFWTTFYSPASASIPWSGCWMRRHAR
jgi:hypothetical protein